MIRILFAWLGFLTFVNFLYDSLKSPIQLGYHKWLDYSGKPMELSEKFGKWAAITGSTDGIGKAFAKELARRGLNIVLISRCQTKLQQVAEEIEKEFAVETFTIQTDFSKGRQVYEHLFEQLAKRPIGILVNNVGIANNPPGTLTAFSHDHVWDMININVAAATLLTHHFIDKWHGSGFKGCIVNISSGLELSPIPFGSVYGASKAFMRSFTLALQHEVKPLGITVQLISPFFVATKINSYSATVMKGTNIFFPKVEKYAESTVAKIGKTSATNGYFWHSIKTTVLNMIPCRLRSQILILMVKYSGLVDDLSNVYKYEDEGRK